MSKNKTVNDRPENSGKARNTLAIPLIVIFLLMVVMVAYTETDVRPGEHVPNKSVELRLMRRNSSDGLQRDRNGACENDAANWGEPETILKLFGGQGTINVNSWAPDSKRFAFVSYVHGDDLSN